MSLLMKKEKNHQKVKKEKKRNESKWKTRRMGGRKNMEILIKEPLKSITKVSVENLELSTLLHLIDCDTIEVINIPVFKEENIILLVDEDGKLKDKKFNFEIYHGGIAKTTFVGNVIFAGINKNGKWVKLNEKQIDFIYEKFSKEY